MKSKVVLALAVAAIAITGTIYAQQGDKKDAPKPAEKPGQVEKTETQTPPVDPNKCLAKIGSVTITRGDIDKRVDKVMSSVPAEHRSPQTRMQYSDRIFSDRIFQELVSAYIKLHKIEHTEEDLKAVKDDIRTFAERNQTTVEKVMEVMGFTKESLINQARNRRLMIDATSDKAVDRFIAKNPNFFNGTMVTASHILIRCNLMAPTKEQKDTLEKIQKIRADILAGKTTFQDAAQKHSDCPSGKAKGRDGKGEYGSLGEFDFVSMVPPFAISAFRAQKGEVTEVVRTQFGFHIIKVTDRKEGKNKIDPKDEMNRNVAKRALAESIQAEIFHQILTTCPLEIMK